MVEAASTRKCSGRDALEAAFEEVGVVSLCVEAKNWPVTLVPWRLLFLAYTSLPWAPEEGQGLAVELGRQPGSALVGPQSELARVASAPRLPET